MAKRISARLQLRRDTIARYNVLSSFIPLDGEVCLVDTKEGLKVKVGDGVSQFKSLEFESFGLTTEVYVKDGKAYEDPEYTTEIELSPGLYIDKDSQKAYYKSGPRLKELNADLPGATSTVPGSVKLFDYWDGNSLDGTITQRAIKEKFDSMRVKLTTTEEMFDLTGLGLEIVD